MWFNGGTGSGRSHPALRGTLRATTEANGSNEEGDNQWRMPGISTVSLRLSTGLAFAVAAAILNAFLNDAFLNDALPDASLDASP